MKVALLIHLVLPAVGLTLYFRIIRRMVAEGEPTWLRKVYFALFFCWGGTLLTVLTSVLWRWSGLASLGLLFLLLVGVPGLFVSALVLRTDRHRSRWYNRAFWASVAFPVVWGVLIATVTLSGA